MQAILSRIGQWFSQGADLGVSRRRMVIAIMCWLAGLATGLSFHLPMDKIYEAMKLCVETIWWLYLVYATDKGVQMWLASRGINVPADQPRSQP